MIRLWKLGNLERNVFPTPLTCAKLSKMISEDRDGVVTDVIWGPDLELEMIPSGPKDAEILNSMKEK